MGWDLQGQADREVWDKDSFFGEEVSARGRPQGLRRATHRTWQRLLPDTLRRKRAIPNICKTGGWHACYDRTGHQVTLWHRGKVVNTWLVRGGSASTPTRTGNTVVYKRDIDHKSGLFNGAPMPYSQFFDGGQALHGSRFMIDPFVEHSHGCINMYVEDARQLWRLTSTKAVERECVWRLGQDWRLEVLSPCRALTAAASRVTSMARRSFTASSSR